MTRDQMIAWLTLEGWIGIRNLGYPLARRENEDCVWLACSGGILRHIHTEAYMDGGHDVPWDRHVNARAFYEAVAPKVP